MRTSGSESIQQSQIIDKVTNLIEVDAGDNLTSVDTGVETSKKVAQCI